MTTTLRLALLALALLTTAACRVELRDTQVWLCADDVQTSRGPVTGCQPTGIYVR